MNVRDIVNTLEIAIVEKCTLEEMTSAFHDAATDARYLADDIEERSCDIRDWAIALQAVSRISIPPVGEPFEPMREEFPTEDGYADAYLQYEDDLSAYNEYARAWDMMKSEVSDLIRNAPEAA